MTRRNSWIRRVIAVGLAAGMVMSTTLPALAERAEGYESSVEAENDFEDGDSAASEEDSKEQEVQTEAAAEESEQVQLSLELLAEGLESDADSPSLSLDKAAELSGKLKVDQETNTVEVTDGEGLILLSNVYPAQYSTYTIRLITTTGWDLTQPLTLNGTSYNFLGLGDETSPYEGAFELDQGTAATQYSIAASRSLFNALSTKAKLGTIPFCISESTPSMQEPLLAGKLKQGGADECLTGKIVLRDLNSDKISNAVIGGLIGTMEKGTSATLTFENQFTKELTISTSSHTGLFCNTMAENTSLTAEFKKASNAGSIKVEATEAGMDAGGFVGHMETDAGLKIAGSSIDQVTSDSGNAGGLVGSVTDGSIQLKEQTTAFSFADTLTVKAGSTSAAGGLNGYWLVTKGEAVSCDLSDYQFKKLVISGGQDVGGLFGLLENTSTAKTAISISASTANTMTAEVSGTVTNFGGIIGTYQSDQMDNTLTIKGEFDKAIDASTSGGANVNSSYGGIIGVISEKSYVEIENVSATTADMKKDPKASFGGLVGKMNDGLLNVGNVALKSSSDLSYDADNVDGRGGLVGHLVKGVLRLHGSTDLSDQKITTAYHHVGQIVGNNNDGLVYALGNGNGLNAEGSGWSLTRYSGADRGGSDIGNWGAVIRLGDKLSEGNDGVVTFDQDAHTVQVQNGNGSEISSANAFAAYVLAFDLSKAYTGSSAALSFAKPVDATKSQAVSLTGDIDLTGTGILGIGKEDNIEDTAQRFAGTLNGNSHTITLDIGTTYGANVSGTEGNAAGQLYAKRSDQRDAHYSLALIPFAGNVTIQDLTIAGTVACRVPKNVKEEENSGDIRYPAFVSAAIGLASGNTTFENVTVNTKVSVSEETDAKKLHVWQAGLLGRCESEVLTFKNCTLGSESSFIDERNTDNQRIGGLAAEVMGDCEVLVDTCTLSGSITSKSASNAKVGGLIAVSRGETQNGTSNSYTSAYTTIKISNLQVKKENINTNGANNTSGGLLGYQWKNTNVVFAASVDNTASKSGVTISGAKLNAKAQFGGLVYQATGYWNATAANSIVFKTENKATTFTGKSTKNTPSGLLVGTGLIKVTQSENVESALYLEAGTWGNASDVAYKIGSDAVTLDIGNSEYFDELVGTTKKDDAGNSNAVVSLAVRDENETAERIDIEGTGNTYTGQLGNYKNGNTRYYYNLDSYRKNNSALNVDSVTSPENMVLWSVAQYAAPNIRGYFRQGEQTDVTITGPIDLTGYSYYPVTPLGVVNLGTNQTATSVTFDYDGMNAKETESKNKQLSDSDHQHYLMQHGLFYHTTHNIAVINTSFLGTIGKESAADAGTYSSGALIYGSVIGDPVNNIVEISLNNVTLAGIRVTEIAKDGAAYAPLLINQMDQAVKLTVNALSTGEGYTTGEGSGKTTDYAATSLIGKVGSATATKLTLSFSNIALDGRLKEDTSKSTSVYNNGNELVDYHTTHTIFTRATLLESFMYSSEGTGTYNFNSTDDKVTYGVELTNTGTTGRNPDKQHQYYDSDSYITDEQNQTANEEYVKSRYSSSKFIRYVYTQQNINESKYELDINQKTTGLLKGCGTYGDPYIIENAHQLSSLAAYIQSPGSVSKFQAIFNSKVLENQAQTAEGYHLLNGATSDATGTDITYTWENGVWKNESGSAADEGKATSYLLNAYYKIDKDITLSAESFGGLGTKENPFSGVIVGASKNNTTVALTGTNANKDSFGGLIDYSRGSVVKDLIVDYSQATITMQAKSLPGSDKNPFFGGVVGYCMGGDTIIDHVSVNYAANSVTFSGTCSYMIAAGGYVGLVGGATHVKENTDYEKTGGGVVFRNMDGTSNTFKVACTDAVASNKTVNMVKQDGTADGKTASNGGNYFYRNPYVGRVLDGYACAEGCTVDNTDKNYTIPTLTAGTNDLQVSESDESLNVTVTSAQGLWLLSAIVNSGAGAMDSSGSYTDVDSKFVDAYQYGKPRTASYEGIGTASAEDKNLADEAYWGGVVSTAGSDTAKSRMSYLVKNYTTGNAAARLAGKSTLANTNIPVMLTFETGSIDMSSYGNGFRGIGSSYGNNKHVWSSNCSIPEVYRRNLLIKSINTDRTEDTLITLNMNQNDYHTEYSSGTWRNQGAGLFVDFHFTDGCKVNHLKISGNVKLGLFDINGKLMCVTKRTDPEVHIGVGGFAARTANSSVTVTFDQFNLENINVYGGTMTGGAIGYIDGYSGAKRNVSFTNWTIQNEKVTKWVYNDGSTGGLVGWNISYGTLSITGNEDSSVKDVDQLSVTTHAENFYTAAAGGLVGANDYSSVTVENVSAQNLSVSGKNLRDLGGLLAEGRKGGTLEVKKCSLASMKITLEINSNQKSSSACTGGIIGFHERPLTISEVEITSDSTINGQQFTGGFVGYSAVDVTIRDCREENINIKTDMNWIGGFIGYVNPNRTATFQNCQEENVNILGRYTGGLVGAMDGSIKASNIEFFNVIGVTYNDKGYAALLVGNTENNATNKYSNKVSGYNLLAKNCKFGYNNKAKVDELSTANIQQIDTSGFWIGKVGVNGTVNLVAVAVQGDDVFPQKDIGTKNGTAAIIYADAFVDQTYQPINSTDKTSSSASPWLDVNPKSEVPFADGTVMTGNGVGMQKGSTTAGAVLKGLQEKTPASDVYWNLLEKKAEFVNFLDTDKDAYVTTYRKEESATTTVSDDVDFPVLVVNNTADVDTMIWNYIAAMTNVSSGTGVKQQKNSITATTYQWDTTQNSFKAKESASLSISKAKKISIVPNAYDNQNSQFTLLDVTYANPTNNQAEPFHLYIPVLVKKVLYISFKTRFLAGTDYCAADYPMNDKATNHYATAGFDEPLTAYIEYSYEKDTDWQSMLDNGENLLWYYDKIMDLASGSTAASGKTLLPSGTRLTLVDRQTKQYYTYTTDGTEDLHKFDFAQMMTSDGKTPFCPVYICDLLDMTVSDAVTEETEGTTYYVVENDPAKATVRVGTTCYRRAEEKDKDVSKYRITITEASKSEARSEGYYLTVQVPETAGYSVINNRLNYGAISRKEGTLPAKITSDERKSGSGYVVYNGVEQEFTVSTTRVHNGSEISDTVMENGDSVKIKLQSTLKLTEAGKDRFDKVGPSEFYHRFDVSLKKYLKELNGGEYDVIGTENVSYTYTLTGNGLNVKKEEKLQNVAGLDTLTLQYGGSELKKALETAKSDETAITATAEIILTYVTADHFPERNTSDSSDSSGMSVVAASAIANTASQLPITTNKGTSEDKNRYYTTNPSRASLEYSAIAGISDATRQLGINPSDEVNSSDTIETRAKYDYSSVDSAVLKKAAKIRYTLELFQKNQDGAYAETPLEIGEYLMSMRMEAAGEPSSSSEKSRQWTKPFVSSEDKQEFAYIDFTPLTGEAFEAKGHTYANYKVRLTAVLLDQDSKEIDGTKASDYIIYTNARIYQQILETMQGAEAGNK